MAPFEYDSPAQSEARWGMYATALHRGSTATEAEQMGNIAAKFADTTESTASANTDAVPTNPQQNPTLPQVARLDRALAVLPLLVLAIVLVLLLAGCSADPNDGNRNSIRAQRDRQYGQLATADVAPTAPALIATQPAPMDTTAAIDSQPCPNGVVPAQLPPRPANLAPQCGEPGGPGGECWPTPEYLPATCPCATSAEIDAALQSNGPMVCYSATQEAAK